MSAPTPGSRPTIASVLVGAYVLSVSVMSSYYWYHDIRTHPGFLRSVSWAPLKASLKALVWPYFLLSSHDRQSPHAPVSSASPAPRHDVPQSLSSPPPAPNSLPSPVPTPVTTVPPVPTDSHPTEILIDKAYHYSFACPRHWKRQSAVNDPTAPARFVVSSPAGTTLAVTVGQLQHALSRQRFESPASKRLLAQMQELTLNSVYRSASRQVGALEMIVNDKRHVRSSTGLAFYISTTNRLSDGAIMVAGLSVIPFERPTLITLMMVAPATRRAQAENPQYERVFASLTVDGTPVLP